MRHLQIHPRRIPGQEAPVELHAVTMDSPVRGVALEIDTPSVRRGPLHRGHGPPFLVQEGPDGPTRVTSQDAQRRGFISVVGRGDTHLGRFLLRHPDRHAMAVCGAGNVGLNAGVLAAAAGQVHGIAGSFGGALVISPSGATKFEANLPPVQEGFALTGPVLVKDGRTLPLRAQEFADPRHLLLFPYLEVLPRVLVDFGHDHLLAHPPLFQRAVSGAPVDIPLLLLLPVDDRVDAASKEVPVDAPVLRKALARKGYREVDRVADRGDYRLHEDRVEIVFLEGIYPHHVLVVSSERLGSILISGASNRAGVVLSELARDLASAGCTHALLSDNGGDVGLYLPAEGRFSLRPAEPDRAATWPLTACIVYHDPAP